jgi:adenine-specific DNA-methyltransferase
MVRGQYIGNKWKHLDFLSSCLKQYGIHDDIESVADLFGGTGAVSHMFANTPGTRRVWANDRSLACYVTLKARLRNRPFDPAPHNLARPVRGMVYRAYSTPEVPFFTPANGAKIDGIRTTLRPTDYEALTSLLEASFNAANVIGKFTSRLSYDILMSRNTAPLVMKPIQDKGVLAGCSVRVTRQDVTACRFDRRYDLVYLDPPYTRLRYEKEYHLLDTIVAYPPGGPAPPPPPPALSFSSPRTVCAALAAVVSRVRCRYIGISYNSEGLLTVPQIRACLAAHGFVDVKVYKKLVKRFQSHLHPADKPRTVHELFILARAQEN